MNREREETHETAAEGHQAATTGDSAVSEGAPAPAVPSFFSRTATQPFADGEEPRDSMSAFIQRTTTVVTEEEESAADEGFGAAGSGARLFGVSPRAGREGAAPAAPKRTWQPSRPKELPKRRKR